jgi:hypothetical protein
MNPLTTMPPVSFKNGTTKTRRNPPAKIPIEQRIQERRLSLPVVLLLLLLLLLLLSMVVRIPLPTSMNLKTCIWITNYIHGTE